MEKAYTNINDFRDWINGQDRPLSELSKIMIDRVKSINDDINSFISVDEDLISGCAAALEKQDPRGALWGVPVAVKDNICIKGRLTTCASHILDGFRPPYNATVIEKLDKAAALLFGRANMDEFAFGSSCETSCYGPTRNPKDLSCIPGGSSGGSAAAVAGGQVLAAIGSDTGGSIRQPASMCGIVSIKPTYGRVSRYGLIAFASSLDQIGPLARNVEDCAALLEIIAGYDEKDSTSVDKEVPKYTESLGKDVKGLTIGIPAEYFGEGMDKEVRSKVEDAVNLMKKLGAVIKNISLPHTRYAVSCYYIIAPAEASSNLARYDGVHYGLRSEACDDMVEMYTATRNEGFGAEVKRRILLGTYSLSSGYYDAYYLKALKVRTRISDDFKKAFEECDCILTPTSPSTAFELGEKMDDPLKMYLSDIYTIPANLAGIPAISLPCGEDRKGLPVGLQLMAGPFAEDVLIRVAHAFESNSVK